MEESKPISDDNNPTNSSAETMNGSNKEKNVREFTEFLEKVSNEESNTEKEKSDSKKEKLNIKSNSLFKNILNEGFDGISSNPNYKMLGLLIILLVNLSLFFVIGNIGKAFLKNSGLM